jgi:hypothetical protein
MQLPLWVGHCGCHVCVAPSIEHNTKQQGHPAPLHVHWFDKGLQFGKSVSIMAYSTYTSGYSWPSDTVRRKCNATCQPLPFLSYREKGERRLSSGIRAGVGDSPRKHTGPVSVHSWQRAWFMAQDPGLYGEIGLRHRPGLILTPAVPHTWAPPDLHQAFFYHSAL